MKSKLEVVNAALEACSQSPVASIDLTNQQVEVISGILERELVDGQTEGWAFNVEDEVTLTPDLSGFITVAADILHVSWGKDRARTPVLALRGARLFNRSDNTYVFTGPIKVRVIRKLDWEFTPQEYREFIQARAIRMAYAALITGGPLLQALYLAEAQARAHLTALQASASNESLLRTPTASQFLESPWFSI
jgi:hypothetical protein